MVKKTKTRRTPRKRGKKTTTPSSIIKEACGLSPVACDYAKALLRADTGPLVGIPNGDSIFSKKYRLWTRGTATGTPDCSIICNPFAAVCNDTNCIKIATGTSALPTDLASGSATNAPYGHTAFGTGYDKVQARLVSALLRVRYTGTQLNLGGLYYGLQEPTHGDIAGNSPGQMMTRTSCQHQAIQNRDWFEIRYRPVDGHDTWWIDGIAYTSAAVYSLTSDGLSVGGSDVRPMGIYAGLSANGPVEYEFWAIVEYAGSQVAGKTITPPDLQGYSTVIAANSQFDEPYASQPQLITRSPSSLYSTVKQYADIMLNAAAPYVHQYAPQLLSAAVTAATNATRRRLPNRQRALLL